MQSHRRLSFKVIVWSDWTAGGELRASTTYEQTGHHGVSEDAVHPQAGHIDLGRLADSPDFTHQVRIEVALESHMTDQRGQPVHARWARVGEGPTASISEHGFCWFVVNCGDRTAVAVPHVASIRLSDRLLQIDDSRELGHPMYIYNLGLVVELPGAAHFITIDPIVTGKGIGVG